MHVHMCVFVCLCLVMYVCKWCLLQCLEVIVEFSVFLSVHTCIHMRKNNYFLLIISAFLLYSLKYYAMTDFNVVLQVPRCGIFAANMVV